MPWKPQTEIKHEYQTLSWEDQWALMKSGLDLPAPNLPHVCNQFLGNPLHCFDQSSVFLAGRGPTYSMDLRRILSPLLPLPPGGGGIAVR